MNLKPAGVLLMSLFTAPYAVAESGGLPQEVGLLQQQAQRGEAQAQYQLAVRYLRGDGVEKNEAQAVTLLEKSAAQHNADAQYVLGSLYAHGNGVTEDKNKAIEFYDKAREQNHPEAQYMLGIMYLEGKYVAPNYKYARYLIGEACKGGAGGACDAFSRLPSP